MALSPFPWYEFFSNLNCRVTNWRVVTRPVCLSAPNGDTSFDLCLGPHCSILLALIGLTTAFSKCNCYANSSRTSEADVLEWSKALIINQISNFDPHVNRTS